MPGDDKGQRPPKPARGSLEPITDFEGKDEDTTAQFWSASRLARNDPKLRESIDRLAAELAAEGPASPPDPAPSMVPMDSDRLGGSLSRMYEEGRRAEATPSPAPAPRQASAGSDEIPRLPPLSAGREPGENTQPLPDVEDPTVAVDDDRDEPPPERARPHRSEPAPPAERRPAGQYDEVSHDGGGGRREATDPGGLGPVDEFTLSLSEDMVRAAVRESTAARREPAPPPPQEQEPAPTPPPRPAPSPLPPLPPPTAARRTRTPTPDPLTTGVVPGGGYDPLTTGVVNNPEPRRASDGTAALMLDGLDDLVLPASHGRAAPREASGQRGAPAEESLRLPDVMMPPPDTARAHKMAAPGRPREAEPVRSQREPFDERASGLKPEPRLEAPRAEPAGAPSVSGPSHIRDPRPAASRPPPPSRPAARPPAEPVQPPREPQRAEPLRADPRAVPQAGPPVPNTAAVKRLEELLTLAEEPPEREETISSSMELLSIADAPPEKEETIGAELVRVDRLQTVAEAPPAGEESVGGAMQRVEDSVDDIELPPSVGQQGEDRRRGQGRPSRPPGRPPDPIDRGASPATVPLPHRVPLADENTRPIPVPPEVQRAPPKPLVSAQLRREVYRPTPTPAPEPARQAPPPRKPDGAIPGLPPESSGGGLQDSLLVWAGTFASLLIGGGIVLMLLLAIAYIV